MTKKFFLPLIVVLLASGIAGCNSSSDAEYTYEYSNSALVTAFSLNADKKVLDSLQNVYFTIDLADYQIFNADSLPYGTNVSRLVPNITMSTGVKEAALTYKFSETKDSVVNYLTNSTDSIDFSKGPASLRVVSQSGTTEKVYKINVNVHQVKPDTLAWSKLESVPLPSSFTQVDAQNTVKVNNRFYCLTSSNGNYCLMFTVDPSSNMWTKTNVSFSFVPKLESMRATDDTVYILDESGNMYISKDFVAWTQVTSGVHYLYGAYGEEMLASKLSDQGWTVVSYPSQKSWSVPEEFPIENTSAPIVYMSEMALYPMLSIVGGRDALGQCTNKTWSFDGSTWANITNKDIPEALEYLTVVAYDLFNVPSSTWTPVKYAALIAMGGRNDNGINRTVYYSTDWGMTWRKAPDLMQLPTEFPVFFGASGYVYSTIKTVSRSTQEWQPIQVKALPPHCAFLSWHEQRSRVTEAPTQWECPGIYLFGGRTSAGRVLNTIWRGQILRYSFQPVY